MYGFQKDELGTIVINQEEIIVIRYIFKLYLDGKSLGGIVASLASENMVSPTGKAKWSRSSVDKMLYQHEYVPAIINEETFQAVLDERNRRSNQVINGNGDIERKTTRYNSQNVLSGLLVCGECGSNYRRITKASGEVVWRCAQRVEHGKRNCTNSSTILESELQESICKAFNLVSYDEKIMKQQIARIEILCNGNLVITLK